MPSAVEPPQITPGFKTPGVIRHLKRLRTASATDHGAQRWRRVFVSLGKSLCSRAVAMICSLLMIPIALRYLGAERYGTWVTLTSIASMLGFFDLGIGVGLQNRIAQMMGTGKLDGAALCLRSALLLVAGISFLLLCALAVIILHTDISHRLLLTSLVSPLEIKAAVLLILGSYVLCLPFGLFSRTAFGLQQGWIASVSAAAVTALTLVAVSIASHLRVGFTTFVILTVSASILGQAVSCILVLRYVPGGLRLFGPVSCEEGFRTLSGGFRYVLPTIGGVIMTQSPLVLLGTLSSPVNAAIYSVFVRISQPLVQSQQMFLDQVWPALTEAMHRGDRAWLRTTLRRLLGLNVAFSACVAFSLLAAVHFLFPFLTKTADLEPAPLEVLLYAIHIGVVCVLVGFVYIANGLVRLRIQNLFAALCALYVVSVLPYCAIRFGMQGLLLALLVLNCAVALPLYFTDYVRYVRNEVDAFSATSPDQRTEVPST